MGKPASQLTKEDKKILSARMAEIKSANGGKTTVQNTIPYMCMYKDGVCQVSENFFSMTVQFYDANYSISEFEEQNNIFSKYCDVINLFDNTIKFQLTFENQNRSKEKLVKTVQIPEQDDDFNAIRKEYSEMLTDKLTAIMQGEEPSDKDTWAWCDNGDPAGARAPFGYWGRGDGQVGVGWGGVGNRLGDLGSRSPVG